MKVNPEKLKTHVLKLSTEFHPRNHLNAVNLQKCVDYISGHFTAAGARLSLQEFTVDGRKYVNISGLFGKPGGERIIIGAHYDSCDLTPGADDNASGVAGLIELAYLFGRNYQGDKEIELVAYPNEEQPYYGTADMGSARHALMISEQNIQLRVMIALEMIGYFSDTEKSQKFPFSILKLLYPTTGNFIAVCGTTEQRGITKKIKTGMKGTTDLPVYSINAPRFVTGIDFSDHRSYWKEGFDAVMITDTSFYRNSNYHRPTDTADTLDYDRMAMVVIAVYESVLTLTSPRQ